MKEPFSEMLRYDAWANRTLIDACREFDEQDLDARVPGTLASVRDLLTHIAVGQQTIAARARGAQQSSWAAWPGFDGLLHLVERANDELAKIAVGLDDDRVVDVRSGDRGYRAPVSLLLAMAFAHGVEHRVQIKAALEANGIRTPDLDSWAYAESGALSRFD